MAKNNLKHQLEDPPMASDGVEVETSSQEEEDENTIFSSEEDEPPTPAIPITVANFNKTKEIHSSGEAQPSTRAVKLGRERPSEGTSTDANSKRTKKVSEEDEKKIEEDTKKPYFQRLWSEEDEFAILQGMIVFKTDSWRMEGFYESVKKSVSFEVSKNQFMEKIRSLKRKYNRIAKNNGLKPSLSRPHEQKCFELSNVIWGPEGIAVESAIKSNEELKKMAFESDVKSNGKSKKVDTLKQELFSSPNGKKVEEDVDTKVLINGGDVESTESDWFEKSFLVRSIESVGVDEHLVKQRWRKVPIETKKRIEEKLKLLHTKELECALQKTDLLREVTSAIAEAN